MFRLLDEGIAQGRYSSTQVATLEAGEADRFTSDQAEARQKGREASKANQQKVLAAIEVAAKQAGKGGTVVLVGHGGVGGSEAVFELGFGETAFLLEKREVFNNQMNGFLKRIGTILKAQGVTTIRFAGCLIGRDKDFAQTLANRIDRKAEFDTDLLAIGDAGSSTQHVELRDDGRQGAVRETALESLVPPQIEFSPQDPNDPLKTD